VVHHVRFQTQMSQRVPPCLSLWALLLPCCLHRLNLRIYRLRRLHKCVFAFTFCKYWRLRVIFGVILLLSEHCRRECIIFLARVWIVLGRSKNLKKRILNLFLGIPVIEPSGQIINFQLFIIECFSILKLRLVHVL
jgi:hypothetical protein